MSPRVVFRNRLDIDVGVDGAFYVDATAGLDTGDGSLSAPWKTVAKVNASSFAAGESILFKKGEEWWETLIPPSSGVDGNVITFGSYGSGADPILHSSHAVRYNNAVASHAAYDKSGLGHRSTGGYAINGGFEAGMFTGYSASSFSGTGTLTADTVTFHSGTRSAKLSQGSAGIRIFLSNGLYLPANQKFLLSFWAKSDGVATATCRLYEDTGGLANTATGDVYQTWTGQQNISALAVAATDTQWTEKAITLLVNGSNHTIDFQITSDQQTGQAIWIDDFRIVPIWTTYSGDTWMAGYETGNTGALWMVAFGGVPTKQAADENAVDASTRWFVKTVGSNHFDVVYIHADSDPNGAVETIDFVTTTNTFVVDANDQTHVTFQGLDLRHGYHVVGNFGANTIIDGCGLTVGVECAAIDAPDVTVKYSVLSYGDWIIDIYDAANNVIIRGNTVFGAKKYVPSGSNEGGGIAPSSITVPITGLLVEDNHIYDCEYYGIAEYSSDATAKIVNATYRRNRIHDVLYGFWSQTQFTSNTRIYANVFYAPKAGAGSGHGASMGLLYERGNNSVFFYNNTVSGFTYGVGLWNDANSLTAKNNIFLNSIVSHVFDVFDVAVAVFDYNCYIPSGAGMFDYNGSHALTFAQWQSTFSQDAHSIAADPLVVNEGAGQFWLQSGSPCRNAGVDLGSPFNIGLDAASTWPSAVVTTNHALEGAGWEIGAYVYNE